MKRLWQKWRRFTRLPVADQLLLAPIWCLLGLARFCIIALPFPVVRRWLAGARQPAPWLHLLPAAQEGRALRLGRLVRLAARHTPWTSNCFPQALVSRTLLTLAGLPHTVFFGLRRDAGGLRAHAWVMSGRVAVSGGHGFARFSVVGCLVWPAGGGPV